MGMVISLEMGDDVIEIIKAKTCSIKNCKKAATQNMCRIGMCNDHYREALD